MKYFYTIFCIILISSVQAQSTRTVLLETSESNQVASSAKMLCIKKDLKNEFDENELAIISYHIDDFVNGGDPLNNQIANGWAQIFSSSFGRGSIDRVSYDGQSILTDYAPEQWIDTIAARINSTTDATVSLPEVLYDPNYDSIFVRTNIVFTDSMFGKVARDMRFFLFVVADGFTADQVFESPRPCDIYPTIPQIIDTAYTVDINNDTVDTTLVEGVKDVTHNDVPILCPTGIQGTDGIISALIEVDYQFNDIQKFAVPEGQFVGNLRIIAFVANFDGNDPTKNRVINVAQVSTFTVYDQDNELDPNHPNNPTNPNSRFNRDNWTTSIADLSSFDYEMRVSPNPVSHLGIIEYNLPNQTNVSVEILDLNGKIVKNIYSQTLGKGPQKAAFVTHEIPAGVYHVRLSTSEHILHKPLVITK